jgi:hypothetical protein
VSRPVSDPYQRLWLGVVEQALEDLMEEPWHSLLQSQAASFFMDGGPWGERRQAIADHLGMHADDLRRVGRAQLAARQAREPAPPVPAARVRPFQVPFPRYEPAPKPTAPAAGACEPNQAWIERFLTGSAPARRRAARF